MLYISELWINSYEKSLDILDLSSVPSVRGVSGLSVLLLECCSTIGSKVMIKSFDFSICPQYHNRAVRLGAPCCSYSVAKTLVDLSLLKIVDKSCATYLTARCASSFGYLFIEL